MSQKNPKKCASAAKPNKAASKLSKNNKNSPNFATLQAEWYKKLADSGFKDIESAEQDLNHRAESLRTKSLHSLAKAADSDTLHYYRRWSCYLAHNPEIISEYGNPLSQTARKALELYAEGMPYRKILALLPKRHKLNLFSLSKLIKSQERIMTIWNKTHYKGLDFIPDIG
jgi:hypothetical protein